MKKYSILILLATLTMFSCQREIDSPSGDNSATGRKVTVDMDVTVPGSGPDTKAFSHDISGTTLRNLYVAVFGYQHYLNEFVKAIPIHPSTGMPCSWAEAYTAVTGDSGKYKIRVTLTESGDDKYVHVVANVPDSFNPTFDVYEDQMMTSDLFTEGDADGYWQYLVFPSGNGGIYACDDPSDPTYANSVNARLNDLKLIRNFAEVKFTLSSSMTDAGYELKAFKLYNRPSKGLFPAKLPGEHAYYAWDPATPFSTLKTTYPGALHAMAEGLNDDDEQTWPNNITDGDLPDESPVSAKFVYESPANSNKEESLFIMAKIYVPAPVSADRYFRIDIVDTDGNRVPIYRNYSYTVTLNDVATAGWTSPRLAAENPSDFNVTASPATASVPEITNGNARMETNYVEKYFTEAGSGRFEYRFDDDISTPTTYSTSPCTVTIVSTPGITIDTGAATYNAPIASGSEWFGIPYTVAAPPASLGANETIESVFKVRGGTGANVVERTVKIVTMKKKTITLNSVSVSASDTKLDFTLQVPAGLPRAMFPLIFVFEDSDQSMSPTAGDLISGYTTPTPPAEPRIIFKKYIRYNDYSAAGGVYNVPITFTAPTTPATKSMTISEENGYFETRVLNY